MREVDKLPPVRTLTSIPPEGVEETQRAFQTDEERANYLESLDQADYEAWKQYKLDRGEATQQPADEAPPLDEATQIAARAGTLRLGRRPFNVANAMQEQGNADMIDPAQLAQMQSMAAAAEASQGRPAQEPTRVEGKGILGGDFGMRLRAGVNGITALPAIPINALLATMPYGGDGDAVGQIMDALGAKRPQTRGERIESDFISGVTGSGAVNLAGKGLMRYGMQEAGEKLAAAPVTAALAGGAGGAASGVVREEGGSSGQQLAAGLLASLSPAVLSSLLKQSFTRGVPKAQMQETIANFAEAGTTPTLGQLTKTDRAQRTEAFLAQFYGSSPTIQKKLAQQEEAVIGRNAEIADSLAPLDLATGKPKQMSPAEMGNMIEDTWLNSGKKAVSNTRAEFGKRLADEVSPRAGVEMPKLQAIVDELAYIDPGAKRLSKNKVFNPNLPEYVELGKDLRGDLMENYKKQIASGVPEEAAKQSLPFEAVRKLKTRLGAQMDNSVFGAQNISQADQRRLFGGIAEDIKAFVKDQGIDAEQAFNDWNKWEVAYHNEVSALRSVLDKNGGPEKVFKATFAGANEGSTILSAVYNNLDEGARDTLTSAWIARASRSASKSDPDESNLGQLFGNYDRLSPEAKDIMFKPEVRESLDKLNAAARTILKSEKDFGMKAGGKAGNLGIQTALYAPASLLSGGIGYQAGGDGGSALLYTLATVSSMFGGSQILAHYMTNPKTVKWMASNSQLPPSAIPTAVNLLSQEARKSQDPDMIEFARLMEEAQNKKEEE